MPEKPDSDDGSEFCPRAPDDCPLEDAVGELRRDVKSLRNEVFGGTKPEASIRMNVLELRKRMRRIEVISLATLMAILAMSGRIAEAWITAKVTH